MSEIEKLYANAGIEPIDTKYEPMGNMVFTADCIGNTWIREQYMKEVPVYPEFTAEKQIELIKWLVKKKRREITISFAFLGNDFHFETDIFACSFEKTFEESLAKLINHLWKSLTEEEKAEIKRILECVN